MRDLGELGFRESAVSTASRRIECWVGQPSRNQGAKLMVDVGSHSALSGFSFSLLRSCRRRILHAFIRISGSFIHLCFQ
jgi:hypothetical protein